MDHESIGSLLFLASLAALGSGGCAADEEPAFRPTSTSLGNADSGSEEPWTDPFQTSGAEDTDADSNGSTPGDGWPSEGETGKSDDTGDWPGETSAGETGGTSGDASATSSAGGDSGGYDEGSSGDYGDVPSGDPCPALAMLYSGCVPEYTYESEIEYCESVMMEAQGISAACASAHAEYLACLSTLNCAQLLADQVPQCATQAQASQTACG